MQFLPIEIRIEGKQILIVGGGKVATHKAQILSRFTREALVVAPSISDQIKRLPFARQEREWQPNDLDGKWIVFICTGNRRLNSLIKREAERRGVLASVCDCPEECDFASPAVWSKDNITIAVGSDGQDVQRAIRIRNRIAELVDSGVLGTEGGVRREE